MVRAHERETSRRLVRACGARRPWWVEDPRPHPPPIRLECESAGPHTVVVVEGDVDSVPSPELEDLLAEQPLSGCAVLQLDVSGVSSVGPEGLSGLLDVRRWCLQRGIVLRVRGAPPSVWRTLEAEGVVRLLDGPCPEEPAPAEQLPLF